MTGDAAAQPPRMPKPGYRRGSFVADVWSSYRRTLLKSVRNPFVLFFGLGQPLIWLLLFTQVFKASADRPEFQGASYLAFFAPAVIIQSALFTATGSGIGLIEDMRLGVFNKLLASPVYRGAMLLGRSLTGITLIVTQSTLILFLSLAMGAHLATGFLGFFGVLVATVLFALGFSAMSNIFGLKTKSTEATIIAVNFVNLPLLFMSTAFQPLQLLPKWLQNASAFNPVRYGIDAVRELMLHGWTWSELGKAAGVLAAFDLVLVTISSLMLRRATDSKARA